MIMIVVLRFSVDYMVVATVTVVGLGLSMLLYIVR